MSKQFQSSQNSLQDKPLHPSVLTVRYLAESGWDLTKKTFKSVFPFCALMTGIAYGLQPQTTPVFSDFSDWIALFIFATGVWILAVLHASVVTQLNSSLQGHPLKFKKALNKGIQKSLAVFAVCAFYIALMVMAWILLTQMKHMGEDTVYSSIFSYLGWTILILPVFLLSISFYLATFVVVLAEYKIKTAWYKRLSDYLHESIFLLRGHWFRFFGLMLLNLALIGLVWGLYQLVLKEFVVIAVLFCVLSSAVILSFWYACVLIMILELKSRMRARIEAGLTRTKPQGV